METLLFSWNEDLMCWECPLLDEEIYMHRYPPSNSLCSNLISITFMGTHSSYEVFDSLHEAQKYLYVKYNKEIRYRDPNEVEYAGKHTNNN